MATSYIFQNNSGLSIHTSPTMNLTGYIKSNGQFSLTLTMAGGWFGAYCEVRLYFRDSSGTWHQYTGPESHGSLLNHLTGGPFGIPQSSHTASVSNEGTISMSSVDTSDGGSYFISIVCGFNENGGQVNSACAIYSSTSISSTRYKRTVNIVIPDYDSSTYTCSETFFLLQEIEQTIAEGSIAMQYYRTDATSANAIIRVDYYGSATKYWAATKTSTEWSSSLQGRARVKAPMTSTYNSWASMKLGQNTSVTTASIYQSYVAYARVVEELKEGSYHLMKAEASINAAEIPPAELADFSARITGTTISLKPIFQVGGAGSDPLLNPTIDEANKNWTARLGKFKTSAADDSEGYAKFQLLSNGITYTIIFSGIMKEVTNNASGGGSSIVDSTDVSYDATTYKLSFEELNVETNRFQAVAYQTVGQYAETDHQMNFLGVMSYKAFCRQRYGSNVIGGDVTRVDSGETFVSIQDTGETTINTSTSVVTTRYLEPFTSYRLYGYLHSYRQGGTTYYCKDFVGDFDAVCYIDFTTLQTAVAGQFKAKVTGKTVTVTPVISRWNGSEKITITATLRVGTATGSVVATKAVAITAWQNKDIVFTGLKNGTKYVVVFTAHDSGVVMTEGGVTQYNDIPIDPIEVVTYGITLTAGEVHSRYIKENTIHYIDGENASNVSQDMSRAGAVKWMVQDLEAGVGLSTVIPATTINCRRINPNKFDTTAKALQPNHKYLLIAYIDGVIYEGSNDTMVSVAFTTLKAAYNLSLLTCATGTTIGVIPSWTESNSPGNTTTVTVTLQYPNGRLVKQTSTIRGAEIWFTGLQRGQEYPIYVTAADEEGSTTNDYITYASGFTGSGTETTYKLSFNESGCQISTRSIRFTITCNRTRPTNKWNSITASPASAAASIMYYIHQPSLGDNGNYINYSTGTRINAGTQIQYTNLVHNTEVEIGFKIHNMYDQNNLYDTEEVFKIKTKLLTLQYVSHEAHVHSLIVNWQCRVEGENYDKDPISNTAIVFVNHGYTIETTEDKEIYHHYGEFAYRADTDGNTVVTTGSGSYASKKWTYTGLESGRIYVCCATVTDGRNTVSNWAMGKYNIKTLNNMVRIWDPHKGIWRRAIPYIYHNRRWLDCSTTHIYHNGKWWECDPERINR